MKLLALLDRDFASVPAQKTAATPKQTPVGRAESSKKAQEQTTVPAPEPKEKTGERRGLTEKEAARRLEQYGSNLLKDGRKKHPAALFFTQFKDVMTLVLLICTAVSLVMGEYVAAITIAVIVLMNGLLGFIQEFRTERTLESLRAMASPAAKVLRDGKARSIDAAEVVPGDEVFLSAGGRIPADGILLHCTGLSCDESMLTGESAAVRKEAGDEVSMGCTVTGGHGMFRVENTGMRTRMGQIAGMLTEIEEEPTPLQKHLAQLSKYIAAGCLLICAVVSITGVLRGEALFDMLITGVSLAVAAVPEGLCAVVTISLALAVSRMVKKNALVRRLHAVETLGCATVICSDKTGTITQNKMTATVILTASGECSASRLDIQNPEHELLLRCMSLCSAEEEEEGFASPTERALLALCRPVYERETATYRRISEIPFDSTRKRMSVTVENRAGERFLFVKGAPDILLNRCAAVLEAGRVVPLNAARRAALLKQNDQLADRAMRVIGAAYRTAAGTDNMEENLIFLGFAGLIDPPREGVGRSIAECRRAGIRTVMITGDHKHTAAAIAKQVGILTDGERVMTGSELDRLSDKELAEAVKHTAVFARVTPAHKLRIVRAFRKNGQITAMTGDGVNDAPAVKEADIGVSMGKSGTDVTKEASDLILLDDDFTTLVNAVAEGRSIYHNIRKFIRYLLSCNIGEVLTMFLGMLFSMPVVLLPIQILLVNLVTDGLPAIALGLEPYDRRVMQRPPRKPDESVFSHGLAGKIIVRGILIGLSTLASFTVVYRMTGDLVSARTGALFALIFAQLLHVFECKSEERTLFTINWLDNKKLIVAALFSFSILLCVMYLPVLQPIFKTCALSLDVLMWPVFFCLAAPVLAAILHRKRKEGK